MKMKKYEGAPVREVKTITGKLPDSFGFPRGGGGVVRKLSKRETEAQRKIMNLE